MAEIVEKTVIGGEVIPRLLYKDLQSGEPLETYHRIPFYAGQQRNVLRNIGRIDPESLNDYLAHGGYAALARALASMSPEAVIDEVERSGLRGCGGGGFPTGRKWRSCVEAGGDVRYLICNGDEGDPGAFMDRSIMEGDPHAVLEGMIIGAYAIGAEQGYIYVREEYPAGRGPAGAGDPRGPRPRPAGRQHPRQRLLLRHRDQPRRRRLRLRRVHRPDAVGGRQGGRAAGQVHPLGGAGPPRPAHGAEQRGDLGQRAADPRAGRRLVRRPWEPRRARAPRPSPWWAR